MYRKCCHGVNTNKLNCLICNPSKKNVCKCNNNGTCELCKEFKPLTKNINECLVNILQDKKIDTSILK